MSLAVWDPSPLYAQKPYVIQGQERPDDLPRLTESAATMERKVLDWFMAQFVGVSLNGPIYRAQTPTMCAEALGLHLTTVRPRITQLTKRTSGPRLERCAWIARRRTDDGGSEGWVRFKEDEA